VIEFQRPAWRIGEADSAKGGDQLFPIADVATRRPQRGIGDLTTDIESGGIETGNDIKILPHAVDEALVMLGWDLKRIGRARDHADCFVAKTS
jgi:hypothetical protein